MQEMTGEKAVSEVTAVATFAGEQAGTQKAHLAVADFKGEDLYGRAYIPMTPQQAMAQISEHLGKAMSRMDDVSITAETTADGTCFRFRAYRR